MFDYKQRYSKTYGEGWERVFKKNSMNELKEAFDLFAQKGSVGARPMQMRVDGNKKDIETSIHHEMMKVYDKFKHLVMREEQNALGTAMSHAALGEGRGEFDETCRRIRKRIWPNG